jgi:serine/threonine-protein kinase
MFDDVSAPRAAMDEEAAFLIPGARFGKFQLIRRLAIGGMAEIHLARALGIEGFEKLVVLKRILPQYANKKDYVQMFLDEARLAASLDHANIVQVHDIGRVGKSYFFTMEYLRGQDVRHVLSACKRAGRSLSLAEALSIVIPTAAGLHYAHERRKADGTLFGVVHRDVSPANVIVTQDGNVKVVDFGIAKSNLRNTQTRAGTLKGKIAYMSPEQCRGDAIDRRSDVFSLGIVLYELVCGSRPHTGENEYAILCQIIGHDAPPPSTKKPGVPEALERILLKALARDPAERYATAQELQRDLEAFARDEKLDVGSLCLQRLLGELNFRHLTEPRLEAEAEPVDDDVAYSVVVEAGIDELDSAGPSAQLDEEIALAVGTSPESSPRGLLPRDASSAPASAPVVHRGRWIAAGAGAVILGVGLALGLSFGGGGGGGAAPEPAAAPVTVPAPATVRVDEPLPAATVPVPAPAVVEPIAAVAEEEAPAPEVEKPAASGKSSKSSKKSRPARAEKPAAPAPSTSWDPDSALPPE